MNREDEIEEQLGLSYSSGVLAEGGDMATNFDPNGCQAEERDGSSSSSSFFPSNYKGSLLLPKPSNYSSFSSFSSLSEEERATAALRVHSQAEKRRRERINAHLSTLRRMIPSSSKMDKASLLAKVIENVKDLRRKAADIGQVSTIPTEVNKVAVECDIAQEHIPSAADDESLYIRASVCCDDRPDLFADLIEAFRGLRLRTIRADITSVGGRVQNVFILCTNVDGNVCLSSLKESIKEVLGRVACMDVVSSNAFFRKRQRLLLSHYSNLSL